jgi:hypothetical protein
MWTQGEDSVVGSLDGIWLSITLFSVTRRESHYLRIMADTESEPQLVDCSLQS